ncbi:glycosyltransferase family 4 protein [Streptomyces roseirectus]|uniref:Glycosyltransferase family 4 protein n=1 Tax=Streptomyces roseirectus TaxID=2768066 RepID=A0A7H0INM8_9ACTN|nr:glycosyltransferase family 4 protein [Streptomyces roseirectus]QNP74394.1 glycosyltransferase family 4 protein [Streptomyces roseirectus]
MNVAFVLLTYAPDEPAGVERAVDSLADGLRAAGHDALIIAAGPAHPGDGPHVVRLDSVTLPRPLLFDDLPQLFEHSAPVRREVLDILGRFEADVVCWADAVVGLGFLNPAPPGARTALMVHFLRVDDHMRRALAHRPDVVLPVSPFMIDEAVRAGLDTTDWRALPNALPGGRAGHGTVPDAAERERLRRTGPVRIVTRADPSKGITELLDACPRDLGRPVQIVIAEAGFELWPGMQADMIEAARSRAAALPDVEVLPAIPWQEVQPFLAGAALTLVPSTSPETFGNVAAESLSAGTPVVGYGFGHLPVLVGGAGRLVDLDVVHGFGHLPALTGSTLRTNDFTAGAGRLWQAATDLLADPDAYRAAARQALRQVAPLSPEAVAAEFLRLTAGAPAPARAPGGE